MILKKLCKLAGFPHDTDERSFRFLNAELRRRCWKYPYLEIREWKIQPKSLSLIVAMIIVVALNGSQPCAVLPGSLARAPLALVAFLLSLS